MRLTCPECGAVASAAAWENDAEIRRAMKTAAALDPAVSEYVLNYLALFRKPGAKAGLQWKKAGRLLSELEALVRAGWVQWDRQAARPVTAEMWGDAMRRVVDRPPRKLPLKSHGYLTAMVYDAADDADRDAETARNKAERVGRTRTDRDGHGNGEPEPLDLGWMKSVRKQNMGKKKDNEKLKMENGE